MQVTDVELAWLGGIIDGEGTITICYQRENSRKKDDRLVPQLSVTNTDPGIVNKIRSILERLGLSFHITSGRKQNSTKEYYVIEITRADLLKIALPILIPHLYGEKKDKAELVLHFVTKRLAYKEQGLHTRKAPYDPEDYELANKVRKKPLPLSSETTRETAKAEDIVQSL